MKFWLGIFLFVVAIAALVLVAMKDESERSDACAARGGTWYHPYKSEGICLKPGTVLE